MQQGLIFAVRERFELSVQFPVRMFSKHVLSATQASHLNSDGKCTVFFEFEKRKAHFFDLIRTRFGIIFQPFNILILKPF